MQSLKIPRRQLHGQTPISGELFFSRHRRGNSEEHTTNTFNIDWDKSGCVRGYPAIYICWPNPESRNFLNLNHQIAEKTTKKKKIPCLISLEKSSQENLFRNIFNTPAKSFIFFPFIRAKESRK